MTLLEQLNKDMVQAMKSKEKDKLSVIRMVKASLQNEAINLKKDGLTSDEELTILSRELKQRKESLHEFSAAGRDDLVKNLEEEIDILQEYMPTQLSEQEVTEIVVQAIQDTQATSLKEIGKVMSKVIPLTKGKADGSKVKQIVESKLK